MLSFTRARTTTAAIAVAGLLMAACGGTEAADSTTAAGNDDGAMDDTTDDGAMDDADHSGDDSSNGDGAMAEGDFSNPVLTSVATTPDGGTLTLAEFAGKTVFVETFATWCSTCRKQLVDTNAAASQVSDDVVFLVLSIETNINPAQLAGYAKEHGFDKVQFAVLDDNGLKAFNDQFGRSVLNAPSTPKFVVGPDGSLSELTTGLESVDEILAQLA